MKKHKIFVTRKIPEVGLNLLKKQKNFEVKISPYDRVLTSIELVRKVKNCSSILSLLTDKIDASVMKAAGDNLKIVANYAVGFDNIDINYAKKNKIIVTNTPGVLTDAVAELTMALVLSATKRIVEADKFTRAGKFKGWAPLLFLGAELKGKTLGIVGAGRIGLAVATRAQGLGMKIIYSSHKRNPKFEKATRGKFVSLNALLKNSDVISLHVPLTPQTTHLIGLGQLKQMKSTAYLINTSRGQVVDEHALVKVLQQGTIAGAALDVFECEPRLSQGLNTLRNVVLTPHIASGTIETRSKMAEIAAQNIINVLHDKKPLTPI
ncbi:MAG: D-glycerate dehydrogenase [Candidatus Buchananbacteria bacterium CG10_big_fil_rev_8_21_14_0_10_42_9]|uniref:D-glycerate dehydrogenase n=1 Tax=Candidatus Buchananbacteria bacterium CG10_big_fil_rev_8_21_14_0_10_42_9 TaxID=1974526 RepID=A0A2H0W1V2_9BACT|nr:MAG: D-glycerate dehydrogenase [Candidatus Buchananbacteria bacterium CG10_big_fil_rev_8_21_14_0_10_42_9]